MGIYSRSPSGARRKRRKKSVRRSKETPRKKRKVARKKPAPARSRARAKKVTKRAARVARKRTAVVKKRARKAARPAKPAKKKIAARKSRAKRTRISKPAKVRKPARTKKAAAKTRARKPTPKKRASRKKAAPKARKRVAPPKKPAKRRRRETPTKAEIAKENRRLRAELAQIKGAEGKAQPTPKKSRARRKVRSKKRGLERARIEQALAIHEYPHATPAEALKSRKEDWGRKQKRFRELFDKAGASGQLPKPERVRRRLDTHRSHGEQTVVRIRRRITARTVESILYKLEEKSRERLSGRSRLWLAKLTLTSMGEKLIGSGNRLLVVRERDQDAEVFYAQSYDSTGAWNTLPGLVDQLRGMLEDYASYRRNVIYLHSIKVQNFERKK